MSDAYDLSSAELLSIPLLPTGVIVGMHGPLTVSHAHELRLQLEERFPGVRFAVIGGCSALLSFTYDDTEEPT